MQTQSVPYIQITPQVQPRPRERLDPLLEARLEAMCQKGCRLVWGDIAALERGDPLPETHDLTPAEVQWLLAELKQVMAVYGARCTAG
ncbi:MAG TPA: hypothetical protein VLM84_13185 [Chromatiaceae bacterium]|nr:hypothetical protein [Chromatiaceae bacterium]